MFPLPWNKTYRKKDGSLTTIDEAIAGGFDLPTASTETKGGIKIGSGLSMDGEILNATGGGTKYQHFVTWNYSTNRCCCCVVTDSSTSLTFETLTAWLMVHCPSETQLLPISGITNNVPAIGMYAKTVGETDYIYIVGNNGGLGNNYSSATNFNDNVVAL